MSSSFALPPLIVRNLRDLNGDEDTLSIPNGYKFAVKSEIFFHEESGFGYDHKTDVYRHLEHGTTLNRCHFRAARATVPSAMGDDEDYDHQSHSCGLEKVAPVNQTSTSELDTTLHKKDNAQHSSTTRVETSERRQQLCLTASFQDESPSSPSFSGNDDQKREGESSVAMVSKFSTLKRSGAVSSAEATRNLGMDNNNVNGKSLLCSVERKDGSDKLKPLVCDTINGKRRAHTDCIAGFENNHMKKVKLCSDDSVDQNAASPLGEVSFATNVAKSSESAVGSNKSIERKCNAHVTVDSLDDDEGSICSVRPELHAAKLKPCVNESTDATDNRKPAGNNSSNVPSNYVDKRTGNVTTSHVTSTNNDGKEESKHSARSDSISGVKIEDPSAYDFIKGSNKRFSPTNVLEPSAANSSNGGKEPQSSGDNFVVDTELMASRSDTNTNTIYGARLSGEGDANDGVQFTEETSGGEVDPTEVCANAVRLTDGRGKNEKVLEANEAKSNDVTSRSGRGEKVSGPDTLTSPPSETDLGTKGKPKDGSCDVKEQPIKPMDTPVVPDPLESLSELRIPPLYRTIVSCLEVFAAVEADIDKSLNRIRSRRSIGDVAVRCRHCRVVSRFFSDARGLSKAVSFFGCNHLTSCTEVPADIAARLTYQRMHKEFSEPPLLGGIPMSRYVHLALQKLGVRISCEGFRLMGHTPGKTWVRQLVPESWNREKAPRCDKAAESPEISDQRKNESENSDPLSSLAQLPLTQYEKTLLTCMELFPAIQEDAGDGSDFWSVFGENGLSANGLVGVRCTYCKGLPLSERSRSASQFPAVSRDQLQRAIQRIGSTHFKICHAMPKEVDSLVADEYASSASQFSGEACLEFGPFISRVMDALCLKETGDGIFFAGEAVVVRLAPKAWIKECIVKSKNSLVEDDDYGSHAESEYCGNHSENDDGGSQSDNKDVAVFCEKERDANTVEDNSKGERIGRDSGIVDRNDRMRYNEEKKSGCQPVGSAIEEAKKPCNAQENKHVDDVVPEAVAEYVDELKARTLTPLEKWKLSSYNSTLLSCVELFTAVQRDIDNSHPGYKATRSVGQVGVRCIYCKEKLYKDRYRCSSLFPSSLPKLVKIVGQMGSDHLMNCNDVPKDIVSYLLEHRSRSGALSHREGFVGLGGYFSLLWNELGFTLSDGRIFLRGVKPGDAVTTPLLYPSLEINTRRDELGSARPWVARRSSSSMLVNDVGKKGDKSSGALALKTGRSSSALVDDIFKKENEFEGTLPLKARRSNSLEVANVGNNKDVSTLATKAGEFDGICPVSSEDCSDLTLFQYAVLSQTRICYATSEDARVRHSDLPIGSAGLRCCHCGSKRKGKKIFCSTAASFGNSGFQRLSLHIAKCTACPSDIKMGIEKKKESHSKEVLAMKVPFKIWLEELWRRKLFRPEGNKEVDFALRSPPRRQWTKSSSEVSLQRGSDSDDYSSSRRLQGSTGIALVSVDDRDICTEFHFLVIQQIEVCFSDEEDRKKSFHKEAGLGYPGMMCKHCTKKRFFLSFARGMARAFRKMCKHLQECKRCPARTQREIRRLQTLWGEKKLRVPRDWPIEAFFDVLFLRLRSYWERDVTVNESSKEPSDLSSLDNSASSPSNGVSDVDADADDDESWDPGRESEEYQDISQDAGGKLKRVVLSRSSSWSAQQNFMTSMRSDMAVGRSVEL